MLTGSTSTGTPTPAAGQAAGQTPPAQPGDQQTAGPQTPAPSGDTTTTTTQQSDADLRAELAAVKSQLSAVNRESADRRHKLTELEAAEQKRKEAEMTETQKLQAKLDALQKERDESAAKVQQWTLRRAFEKAARTAKLNFASDDALDDGFRLADLSAVKVNGENVEGIDAAVIALSKAKPYLFKPAEAAPPDVNATDRGAQGKRTGHTIEEAKEFAAIYGVKAEFIPTNTTPGQGR